MAKAGGAQLRATNGKATRRDGERLAVTRSGVRRKSRQSVGKRQVGTFLETLAETCNITLSAKAAGFSTTTAYNMRRRDAAFRAGWAAAVAEGYAKLELVLLERAMNGTIKRIPKKDGGEMRVREFSSALAIALLRHHRDTAEAQEVEIDRQEVEEARERILDKLARIKARLAGGRGERG